MNKTVTHSAPGPSFVHNRFLSSRGVCGVHIIVRIHIARCTSVSPVADMLETMLVDAGNYRGVRDDSLFSSE